MKNKVFIFVFALLVVSAFRAPALQTDADTTISFWYTEGAIEGNLYDTLIANFESTHPGVTIDARQIGYFDTEQSYYNALIAGTEPNVLRADVTWITNWANQKVFEPLDGYDWKTGDYLEDAIRLVQWRGATYGIPQVVDTLGMMYNKHTLETAGITVPDGGFTFDQFASAAYNLTDLTSIDQANWTYGFNLAHMSYHFLPIFYGHGAKYFSPNSVTQKNIALDSQETKDAIQYMDNLIGNKWQDPTYAYKGVTPSRDLQTYSNLNEYFMNGKVAMIQQGPWELRNFLDNAPMFNKTAYESLFGGTAPNWVGPDNLGFMEVPKTVLNNGTTYQGMHIGGHAYVMSKKVPQANKPIVFEFMKYLAGPEANYLRGKLNHLVSPLKSFYTSDFDTNDSYVPANDTYIQGFRLNLDNSFARPVHPYFITMDGFFAEELQKHLLEEQDIADTIAHTLTKWNNYFNQFGEIDDHLPTSGETSGTSSVTSTASTASSIETTAKPTPYSEFFTVLALVVSGVVFFRRRKQVKCYRI